MDGPAAPESSLAAVAIREYTETNSVGVELTSATRDPFTLG